MFILVLGLSGFPCALCLQVPVKTNAGTAAKNGSAKEALENAEEVSSVLRRVQRVLQVPRYSGGSLRVPSDGIMAAASASHTSFALGPGTRTTAGFDGLPSRLQYSAVKPRPSFSRCRRRRACP